MEKTYAGNISNTGAQKVKAPVQVKTPKGKVFRLINLPFYLIGNLHQILDEVI